MKKILISALSLFLYILAMNLYGCTGGPVGRNSAQMSVYDRVMRDGKIRCAYGVYPPNCIKDPNTGKLSGIGIDAIELVAKKLGLQAEWTEEIVWGTMIEGLETNRYDLIATAVLTNSNRARRGDFCKPLFFSPWLAYVRNNDKRFDDGNLNKANSPQYTITTLDGATAQLVANEDFPNAKQISLPEGVDLSQLLVTVASGKADLTFSQPVEVNRFLIHNPNDLKPVKTAVPLRIYPNSWLIKHGQEEFKNMINTVLDEIKNDGTLDKIIHKYEPQSGTLYSATPPYALP